MSHDMFVYLSYGAAAVIFAIMLAWMFFDRASTMGELRRLEALHNKATPKP